MLMLVVLLLLFELKEGFEFETVVVLFVLLLVIAPILSFFVSLFCFIYKFGNFLRYAQLHLFSVQVQLCEKVNERPK